MIIFFITFFYQNANSYSIFKISYTLYSILYLNVSKTSWILREHSSRPNNLFNISVIIRSTFLEQRQDYSWYNLAFQSHSMNISAIFRIVIVIIWMKMGKVKTQFRRHFPYFSEQCVPTHQKWIKVNFIWTLSLLATKYNRLE